MIRILLFILISVTHIGTFVIDYTLDSISTDNKRMVFVSESIINIPEGWQARETYKIWDENEFEGTFELAAPGRNTRFTKRQNLSGNDVSRRIAHLATHAFGIGFAKLCNFVPLR